MKIMSTVAVLLLPPQDDVKFKSVYTYKYCLYLYILHYIIQTFKESFNYKGLTHISSLVFTMFDDYFYQRRNI